MGYLHRPLGFLGVIFLVLSDTANARREQSPDGLSGRESGWVCILDVPEKVVSQVAKRDAPLHRLLLAARPTIGVPYRLGGSDLENGIDCSYYTWRLYRSLGLAYLHYACTLDLSRVTQANGLVSVSFEEARPGDLLVYGHLDRFGKWRGHVVVLIDKTGKTTGRKGLVLGAHGDPVDAVQFITFRGFEEGFFVVPKMRLVNVLRVVDWNSPGGRS